MKKIIESSYILARQAIDKRRIVEQDETKLSKELQNNENSCIFPKDKIDIADIAKQVIQSTDDRQVELTYSIPLKRISADIINKDGSRIEVKNENLPKELKEISDPKLFFTFLRNTYAKITELSDGDYKFYINHKLLGGNKEYMFNIIYSINDRIKHRISSKQALENLDINYDKYINVNDSILVTGIRMAQGFISEQYMNDVLYLNDIDRTYFEKTVDEVIYLKQKELIDNTSYELLFSLSNGLETLKNKIFNKEDPFTIHAVKYFFNSVNSTKASDIDIKGYLENPSFIHFIYTKLITRPAQIGKERFIKEFKNFEIQSMPTKEERDNYLMPQDGICHGACIVSCILEEDTFKSREHILRKSSSLQQEYHKIRNPDETAVYNLLISKVMQAVNNLPEELTDKIDEQQTKVLIRLNNFQNFLKENNISLIKLLTESRIYLQAQALQNNSNKELQIFANAEEVLMNEVLTIQSFNTVLEFLNGKILTSASKNKYIILITLEEKATISEAIRGKEAIPQAHDIMIRVDTNTEGYISLVIFSDLQEAGLYTIKPAKLSKKVQDSSLINLKIIEFYTQNIAIHLFDRISAKYIII